MTSSDDRTEDELEVNDMEPTHWRPGAWRNDEVLLAALKDALAPAQHPRHDQLIADAQDAFSFATIADEVAALVFDSMWEDKLETASRAVATVRTLVFESADLSLEIEVSSDGIIGQVTPGGQATVEAERADGRRTVIDTDEFGSFTLAAPGSGPLRFHLRGGGTSAVTDWVNAAA